MVVSVFAFIAEVWFSAIIVVLLVVALVNLLVVLFADVLNTSSK